MDRIVKEDLSQLIRRVVREKNLKLRDVESKSGGRIAQSYVSRLMTGNVRNLTIEKLIALARGLDMDPHALFTAAHGHAQQLADESNIVEEMGALEFAILMRKVASSPDLMQIVKRVAHLKPEEGLSVLSYIESLSHKKKRSQRKEKSSELDETGRDKPEE